MQAPLETDDTSPQTTAKCKEMVNEACKLLDVELAVAHQVAHQKNREIAHPTASMWQHKLSGHVTSLSQLLGNYHQHEC